MIHSLILNALIVLVAISGLFFQQPATLVALALIQPLPYDLAAAELNLKIAQFNAQCEQDESEESGTNIGFTAKI